MGLFDQPGEGTAHKGGRLKQVFEMAKPALNLSADQEQKIREIFKDFREERQEIKTEQSDNQRDEMRTARQETKQKLMAVLNDDQKKVFEQNLQQWKDKAS